MGLLCLAVRNYNEIYMNIMKKVAVVLVFALMVIPGSASAATYYNYGGQTMSQQELIQHLYQLIAQLQAQLGSQGGSGSSSYGLSVQTVNADNVDEDSASLNGNLNLGTARTARVWFDYGLTQSMSEQSLTGTATKGGAYTFRADVTGLEEGETYYYRAVAEDPSGREVRGSIRSFETDGDRDRDDDDDDDRDDDDRPDATTEDAENEDEDSAELNGEVDMNDF